MADKSQETAMDVSEERTEKDPKTSSASGGEVVEQDEDVTEEEVADTGTAEGDANGELDVSKMKVTELRAQLKDRGLDTKGAKAVLVERLQEAINAEVLEGEEEDGTDTGDDILEDVKPEETKEEAMEVEEQKEGATEEGKTEETKEEVKEGSKKEESKEEEEGKESEKASTTEAKDKEKKTEQAKATKEEKKEEVEVVEVANPPPPELPKFWKAVKDNPGDFTGWTYLLQYVEQKNHLESVREAFNAFFERYPYCYGYWKKFADTERRHGNMEQAKEIFERGLKSIQLSIDLWIHYVNFTALMHEGKPEKSEKVREMYEHAVDTCGTEFRSDKLWDAYIKFETENKEWQRVTAIYDRLFTIPTQLYSHHFDKFKEFVQKHHPKDIISLDEFIKFRLEVVAEKGPVEETEGPIEGDGDDDAPPGCDDAPPGVDAPNKDVESKPITDEENKAIQQKIIALRETEYKKNEQEVSKRWAFEEGIRRPYFHAKALEKGQLKNWKEYLDFEITNGTHERVVVLFERCLIACALYEDYWIKFAKYMESHNKEEVSTIYRRACTIHLMKKPNIHLHWAAFEEEQGNIDTAREVLAKLEENLPNLVMVTLERINLERRHGNTDNVLKLYEDHIKDATNEKVSSFYSVRLARYLCKVMGNRDKAQTIIEAAVEKDKENIQLYLQLFDLELQKKPLDEDSILCLFDVVQELPFDTATKVRFSHRRLEYLLDFGTDVGKLHSAQEDHQKLLKVKDEEQKAAIAAASAAVAKKRTTDQSGGGQPIKKSRPEGREAARLFHQQQQSNFQQNQGYSYNQGQWGNFQPIPDPPGQDDVIVIDDDQASNADVWAWSIGEEDSEPKKSGRNGSSRRRSDSRSRESSRRRSRGRDSPKRRRGRSRSRSPRRNRSRSPRRTAHSRSPNRSARPRSPSRHQRSRSPSKSKTASSSKVASSSKAKSSTPSESEKKKTTTVTTEKIQEEMKDVQNAWQGAGATLRMLAAESSEVEEVQYEVTDVYESSSSPEIVESEPIHEVEGFVHNMTPIKSGKNSAKYFYAILQVSQKDYINMVCFSTEKHELLMSMARNKGALKFSNITYIHSRIGSGGKDVTVNTRTRITKTNVKFYATKPFWSFLANFCSLHSAETRVADGDHIHVAVTVQSCNNKTDQLIVRGNEVDRKDFVVTDKSGNITLSTWGEYTDVLQIGKTYMVGNVTVKLHKGVKCLNTNIRTSIIEGVWDRKKHELDYTVVFPSVYPEDGGSSLEDQKKVALQPSPGRSGLLGQGPSRTSSRDLSRSTRHSGGDYLGSRTLGSSVRSSSTTNPYQNYQQPWGNYQQNYYGGGS